MTTNPQIDGLIQLWGIYDNPAANVQGNNKENEFRRGILVRRTQVKLKEKRSDKLKWEVKFDLARNFHDGATQTTTERTKTLLDMFVDYQLTDNLEVRIGQFKEVTVQEGLDSSSQLFFIERSYIGRYLGNQRDKGLMLTHTKESLNVQLVLLNGDGINQPAGEHMRKFIGNLSYGHIGKKVGVWINHKTENETEDDLEDSSYGVYIKFPIGKLTFQGELARQSKQDKAHGQFLMAKYQLTSKDVLAVRFDSMKNRPKDNEQMALDLGFTHFLEKDVTFKSDLRGGREKSTGQERAIEEFIIQLQVKF